MPAATSAKWPFISSSAHEAQPRSEVWSLGLVSLAVDVGLLIFRAAEQLLCLLEVQVCLLVPF